MKLWTLKRTVGAPRSLTQQEMQPQRREGAETDAERRRGLGRGSTPMTADQSGIRLIFLLIRVYPR